MAHGGSGTIVKSLKDKTSAVKDLHKSLVGKGVSGSPEPAPAEDFFTGEPAFKVTNKTASSAADALINPWTGKYTGPLKPIAAPSPEPTGPPYKVTDKRASTALESETKQPIKQVADEWFPKTSSRATDLSGLGEKSRLSSGLGKVKSAASDTVDKGRTAVKGLKGGAGAGGTATSGSSAGGTAAEEAKAYKITNKSVGSLADSHIDPFTGKYTGPSTPTATPAGETPAKSYKIYPDKTAGGSLKAEELAAKANPIKQAAGEWFPKTSSRATDLSGLVSDDTGKLASVGSKLSSGASSALDVAGKVLSNPYVDKTLKVGGVAGTVVGFLADPGNLTDAQNVKVGGVTVPKGSADYYGAIQKELNAKYGAGWQMTTSPGPNGTTTTTLTRALYGTDGKVTGHIKVDGDTLKTEVQGNGFLTKQQAEQSLKQAAPTATTAAVTHAQSPAQPASGNQHDVNHLVKQDKVLRYGGRFNVTKNVFADGSITYVKDGKVLGRESAPPQPSAVAAPVTTPAAQVSPAAHTAISASPDSQGRVASPAYKAPHTPAGLSDTTDTARVAHNPSSSVSIGYTDTSSSALSGHPNMVTPTTHDAPVGLTDTTDSARVARQTGPAASIGFTDTSYSAQTARTVPAYSGGAEPVSVEHLKSGATLTTTATGAEVEQMPGHSAYQVRPPQPTVTTLATAAAPTQSEAAQEAISGYGLPATTPAASQTTTSSPPPTTIITPSAPSTPAEPTSTPTPTPTPTPAPPKPPTTSVGYTDTSYSAQTSRPAPAYTGGASPVKVEHLNNGATLTTTATGAEIEQMPGRSAYEVKAPTHPAVSSGPTQLDTPHGSLPTTSGAFSGFNADPTRGRFTGGTVRGRLLEE